jgi:hypothetical protein
MGSRRKYRNSDGLEKSSPPSGLAWHDKGGGARLIGTAAVIEPASGEDHDQQCEYDNQIDVSGIATSAADFPAH